MSPTISTIPLTHPPRAFVAEALSTLSGLVEILRDVRLPLELFSPVSLAKFQDLDEETLRTIHFDVSQWIRSLREATVVGGNRLSNLHNEGLKAYLRLMKWRIPEDFVATIGDRDIVEIYTFDPKTGKMRQSWRNWLFMSMCSYDLITLMTKPMEELFERDSAIQDVVVRRTQEVLQNPVTQACGIPTHVITERLHPNNRQFLITNRFVAPVFEEQTNTVVGFVATLEATPLGSAYAHLPNVEPLAPPTRIKDV